MRAVDRITVHNQFERSASDGGSEHLDASFTGQRALARTFVINAKTWRELGAPAGCIKRKDDIRRTYDRSFAVARSGVTETSQQFAPFDGEVRCA